MDLCEAKRKEWAKHWQCDESVQKVEDNPLGNEELKSTAKAEKRVAWKKCRDCTRQKE